MNDNAFRVISWNIAAPELVASFWQKSYGFKQPVPANLTIERMTNIVEALRTFEADVIALQEVTDQKYRELGNQTIQDYIARELGQRIVSVSFKKSPFSGVDTGVATLVNPKRVQYTHLASAEDFGPSELFRSGVGSPFTLDEIKFFADRPFYLLNLHIRMTYPHIADPLDELERRASEVLDEKQFADLIAIGDFNAEGKEADNDLRQSRLFRGLHCYHAKDPRNDYCLVGPRYVEDFHVNEYEAPDIPTLIINVATQKQIEFNHELLQSGSITTDHPLLIVDIEPKT